MKIGIDIDGVLTNLQEFYFDYGSKFSYENKLDGIVNINSDEIEEILDCDKKYHKIFWNKYLVEYTKEKYTRVLSWEIIKKLKEDGDEIHIITARKDYEIEWTIKWLKDNEILYDKIVFDLDKLQYCIENKIDVMIEDNAKNINNISKEIPVICVDARYNVECTGKNITRCYSWYNIYGEIIKIKKNNNFLKC